MKTGRPWFRKQTDSWYVWHRGRQVPLAKGRANKAAAYARFAELLREGPADSPPLTVGALVAAYKEHLKGQIKPTTLTSYAAVLAPLVKELGERLAGGLGAADLEAWAARPGWSATTRRFGLTVAAGALRWAERSGLLPHNPIRNLHKPPGRSRGAEVLIDGELHGRLLGVVSPEFRDFLTVVLATGARPGEVARIEAANVAWDAGCVVLAEHKTAKATGRVRVIHLPPQALEVCRKLAAVRPSGPLFLSTRGRPWQHTGWKQAMGRAQRKLGLGRRPLTSGYRHTFATDALSSGVPDAQVAELLGHSSTAMLFRHYGHLSAKARQLREALGRVRP
jgi:integrase